MLGSCFRILRSKLGFRDIKFLVVGVIVLMLGGLVMVVMWMSEYYLLG